MEALDLRAGRREGQEAGIDVLRPVALSALAAQDEVQADRLRRLRPEDACRRQRLVDQANIETVRGRVGQRSRGTAAAQRHQVEDGAVELPITLDCIGIV